jgi:hypothetical protein
MPVAYLVSDSRGIKTNTKTCGVLKGATVAISESGVSALPKLEVPLGEFVELQFMLAIRLSDGVRRGRPTECFSLRLAICRVAFHARNHPKRLPKPQA